MKNALAILAAIALLTACTKTTPQPQATAESNESASVNSQFSGSASVMSTAHRVFPESAQISLKDYWVSIDDTHEFVVFFVGREIKGGFESMYWRYLVFVKKRSDRDWSGARVFDVPDNPAGPFHRSLAWLEENATEFSGRGPGTVWNAAEAAFAASDRTKPHEAFTSAFVDQFLRGFLDPKAVRSRGDGGPPDGGDLGFLAGQKLGREHPDERNSLLLAYGYTVVESVGDYVHGFEASTFFPNDGGVWWVDSLGPRLPEQTETSSYRLARARYRVRGYLSPAGKYGHLGMAQHHFLATGIELDADAASATTSVGLPDNLGRIYDETTSPAAQEGRKP